MPTETWANFAAGGTPIDAERLDLIEARIEALEGTSGIDDWADGADGGTALSAERLNVLEQRLETLENSGGVDSWEDGVGDSPLSPERLNAIEARLDALESPPVGALLPGFPSPNEVVGLLTGSSLGLADAVRVMLVTSAWTPDPESDVYAALPGAHEASGVGYAARQLTTRQRFYDPLFHYVQLQMGPVQWSGLHATFRYVVAYRDTGSLATSPIIAVLDFGDDHTASGNVEIDFPLLTVAVDLVAPGSGGGGTPGNAYFPASFFHSKLQVGGSATQIQVDPKSGEYVRELLAQATNTSPNKHLRADASRAGYNIPGVSYKLQPINQVTTGLGATDWAKLPAGYFLDAPGGNPVDADGNITDEAANPSSPVCMTCRASTFKTPGQFTTLEKAYCQPTGPGRGSISGQKFDSPIYTVPADQPLVPVYPWPFTPGAVHTPTDSGEVNRCLRYTWGTDKNGDPIPGGGVPVPPGAEPSGGTDGQAIIWQPSSDTMWDFWNIQFNGLKADGTAKVPALALAVAWREDTFKDTLDDAGQKAYWNTFKKQTPQPQITDDNYYARFGGKIVGVKDSPGHFRTVDNPAYTGTANSTGVLTPNWTVLEHLAWGGPANSVPNLPGLITVEDIRRCQQMEADGQVGEIGHALVVALWLNDVLDFCYPGQRTDGNRGVGKIPYSADSVQNPTGAADKAGTLTYYGRIPQGARFRLRPNFDVSTLERPIVRWIAKAVQDYGFVTNNSTGGGVNFYTENWLNGGPDKDAPLEARRLLCCHTADGTRRTVEPGEPIKFNAKDVISWTGGPSEAGFYRSPADTTPDGPFPSDFMREFPWEHLECVLLPRKTANTFPTHAGDPRPPRWWPNPPIGASAIDY